jgi:hypothetical protein
MKVILEKYLMKVILTTGRMISSGTNSPPTDVLT